MTIKVVHTVELDEDQIDTILRALRYDYRNVYELGALPFAEEIRDDIKSAWMAITTQTGITL